MSNQSLVPFSHTEIVRNFGPISANLVDIRKARDAYPDDYQFAAGMTDEEKQLDMIGGRIEGLIDVINDQKIEIGFLVFVGNQLHLYRHAGAGVTSMEDYLKNVRHLSASMIEEAKKMYKVFIDLAPHGIEKEKVQQASITQIDAIKEHVSDIKKQYNDNLDKRAQKEGAKDFRSLPSQKKEVISQEVQQDYQRALQEGVDFILESPPSGEVHQAVAASGGKPDRPLIILRNVQLEVISHDPPVVILTFGGGNCELNEQQIASMKRENVRFSFVTEDSQELSLKGLGYWADDAL